MAAQSSCTPGTNGAPPDLDLASIDSTAADFAQQTADALSTGVDNAVNGLPDDPSTAFQAYEDHFGLPPARGPGFLNRLTGAVRSSQGEAASGELRILSRRFQLVANLFNQPVVYLCLAADQNRVFSNALFTCSGGRFSGSSRGTHAIGLCPPFWNHDDSQRAGGLIHEAMHIIFGRQEGTIIGGAIRDDDTVPQVPGRNFDAAGCYQSLVADVFGFDPDVVCADPL